MSAERPRTKRGRDQNSASRHSACRLHKEGGTTKILLVDVIVFIRYSRKVASIFTMGATGRYEAPTRHGISIGRFCFNGVLEEGVR